MTIVNSNLRGHLVNMQIHNKCIDSFAKINKPDGSASEKEGIKTFSDLIYHVFRGGGGHG